MTGSAIDYDKLLQENKDDYYIHKKISKDEYESRARVIRRQRRKANSDSGTGTGAVKTAKVKSPKTTTRKPRGSRRKKVLLPVDTSSLEKEIQDGLEAYGVKFVKSADDKKDMWHATPYPVLHAKKQQHPELNMAQVLFDKFKHRWLIEPKQFQIVMQGEMKIYWLGPVPAEDVPNY